MKIDIKKIAAQGKELWDKYGDTVIDVAAKAKSLMAERKSDQSTSLMATEETATMPPTNAADEVVPVAVEPMPAEAPAEDTFFEDSTAKLGDAVKAAADGGFQDPEAVVAALKALGEVANDTVKYVANQETRQEEIRAQRDVAIAQIRATSECIKTYLDKTFDERSAIFGKQFEVVDEALRTGNTEMLAMSLQSINALAAQSPFKSLADIGQVKQALTSGNTEWDI